MAKARSRPVMGGFPSSFASMLAVRVSIFLPSQRVAEGPLKESLGLWDCGSVSVAGCARRALILLSFRSILVRRVLILLSCPSILASILASRVARRAPISLSFRSILAKRALISLSCPSILASILAGWGAVLSSPAFGAV